jgi:hypothetical protein
VFDLLMKERETDRIRRSQGKRTSEVHRLDSGWGADNFISTLKI